jgi:hypothetical protein
MFLVLLSYLAFFSIALPDSMLGVAWPAMRISFQQPISTAGLVPPMGVAATLVSTTSSGYLLYRIGLGRLLAASSLFSAVALAGSATSPTKGLFLVSVVLLGLSGGAIDATLNGYAARTFGPRRINLLVELELGRGRSQEALADTEQLSATASRLDAPALSARSHYLLGRALAAVDNDRAARELEQARVAFVELTMPYDAARSRLALARLTHDADRGGSRGGERSARDIRGARGGS